ncbi:hypothetical protein D3C86_2182640 [compost metagenome]
MPFGVRITAWEELFGCQGELGDFALFTYGYDFSISAEVTDQHYFLCHVRPH